MPSYVRGTHAFHPSQQSFGTAANQPASFSAPPTGTSQDISRSLPDVEDELTLNSIPHSPPSIASNPNSINLFNSHQSKGKSSALGDDSMSIASGSLSLTSQVKCQCGTNSSALYSLGIKIDQMTKKLTSSPDAKAKTHVHDHSPQCRSKAAQHLQKLKKDLSNEQKVVIMDLFKTNMAAADMFLALEEEDESLQWAWISNKLLQMGHPALPPCQSAMELE